MSLAQRHLPLEPPPETWGDSDFPPRPLKTARPGGLRAPYSGLHPQVEGAAAESEAILFDNHPESGTHAIECGTVRSLFPKTKAHPVQTSVTHRTGYGDPRFRPNFPRRENSGRQRFSFGPCTARQGEPRSGEKAPWGVFFGKTKENGGCIPPVPRSGTPPVPARWRILRIQQGADSYVIP